MSKGILSLISGLLILSPLLFLLAVLPASAEDAVMTVLNPPRFEISNGRITVWYAVDQGVWGLAAQDGSVAVSDSRPGIQLGDQTLFLPASTPCSAQREEGRDGVGDYARLNVVYTDVAQFEELVWSATLRPDAPYAVFALWVRAKPDAAGPLRSLQLLDVAGGASAKFGAKPERWMCFSDSGHQSGTRVAPCFDGEEASHSSPATLMLHDGPAGQSLLLGWLSWANSNPGLTLTASKAQRLTGLSAQCACYAEDLEEASSEPLLVSVESDPLVALEQYAREVCQANKPPIREDTVMGWLSWYCSRLAMTEDFVLSNAKVISERFRGYGIDTMQVDHGWEYRDVVGNWVTNDRFPHGLDWLSNELKHLDLKLGIWIAASCVSEHTPFYAQHPDALIRNTDGTPKVFIEKWHWAPHGRVFSLDPTHPAAQQHYRDSLQPLVDAGVHYYKVDFIGSAGNTDGVFHDPKRPRGYPMLRYEMQQIRDVVGADSWLRYCSAPSNAYCGIVNIGGATMDIGNASGNWDHLRGYHQQLSSCWYKHRTFWHNEPDALIVGEGEENEARLRCAWLVLSGGVVALGDDLTKIAPDRMALISKCLPSYDVVARPLDLFESIPVRTWALTVNKPWGTHFVLGLFNLSEEKVTIPLPLARLGLEGRPVAAWEFWTQSPVSPNGGELSVTVPANDSRVVAVQEVREHPQVIATDMHLTMGGVELSNVDWNPTERTLSGAAVRTPGERGMVFVHVPEGYEPVEGGLMRTDRILYVPTEFTGGQVPWSVKFRARGN